MRVGRYRLQERMGRGTMGEVWRAYDSRLKRAVAIKLLDPFQNNPTELERFLQEARALARLNHPNVVAVYDVGDWPAKGDARPYIVMELVEGHTLADELATNGPLSADDVRAVGVAITSGLRAAHDAGVVHRDLAPDNLMRTADGTVKLVDFGIADIGRQGRLTRPGILLGSVSYVAPERVRGDRADARSDLYSVGCVLYELLCGRPPFEGDLVAVAFAHVFNDVVPPSAARPDVPDDLEAVVLALLAKDPAARPPTAASVLTALRDGVELPEPAPVAEPEPEPAAKPTARRVLLTKRMSTVLAAFAVVVVAIGLSSSFTPDVERPAKAAPASSAPLDNPDQPRTTATTPTTTPTTRPTPTRTPKPKSSSSSQPDPEETTQSKSAPPPLPIPTATVTTVVTVPPTSSPTPDPTKSKKPKKPKKPKD
jgi:serine/threonine protein kinase